MFPSTNQGKDTNLLQSHAFSVRKYTSHKHLFYKVWRNFIVLQSLYGKKTFTTITFEAYNLTPYYFLTTFAADYLCVIL